MITHVIGTGSTNKGAELMLHAIARQRSQHLSDHELTVPMRGVSLHARRELGLLTLAPVPVPRALRRRLGLASAGEVSAVLDASGFRYGDQWGAWRTETRVREFETWKRRGARIVLLPQALGPFHARAVRDAFLQLLDSADIVYARDSYSLGFALELNAPADKVRLSPDITIPLGVPNTTPAPTSRVLVIPNMHMTGRMSGGRGEHYVDFLSAAMMRLRSAGLDPQFLIHQTVGDDRLVHIVNRRAGYVFPLIREVSPLELKRILGSALFVIGSRFHALVGALSQGVPAIGTSWSHKYRGLFEDFGVGDLLIENLGDERSAARVVDLLIDPQEREQITSQLEARATQMAAAVDGMWRDVAAAVRSTV